MTRNISKRSNNHRKSKSSKSNSGKSVKDIIVKACREADERRIASLSLNKQGQNGKNVSTHQEIDVPRVEEMLRPGEVEKVISNIADHIKRADRKFRHELDLQMMRCFALARILDQNKEHFERLIGGNFAKMVQSKSYTASKALQFVLGETMCDRKKASLYFRATRKMFEGGLKVEDLPQHVRDGGGYQELANENAKSNRSAKSLTSIREVEATDHGSESTDPDRQEKPETDQNRSKKAKVIILGTLRDDGRDFEKLPNSCYAHVGMKLKKLRDGNCQATILYAYQSI